MVHNRLTKFPEEILNDYFFVSTEFYTKLEDDFRLGNKPDLVKCNIFEKQYVIIPQNIGNEHWCLIIICNPGNIVDARNYFDSTDKDELKRLGEMPAPIIFHFDSSVGLDKNLVPSKKPVCPWQVKKVIMYWLKAEEEKRGYFVGVDNPFHKKYYNKDSSVCHRILPIIIPLQSK